MHIVFWKRLDQDGHDACRISETPDGWVIQGAAVFAEGGQAAHLTYRLVCDRSWASVTAAVTGWIGETDVRLQIDRDGDGGWRINGRSDPALAGLKDIDLGFTPASNTNAIRRLNLSMGEAAESVAVWLDTEDWSVKPLRQSYRRTQDKAYDYASPQHGYRATLEVDDFGAVTDYPGLWTRRGQGQA